MRGRDGTKESIDIVSVAAHFNAGATRKDAVFQLVICGDTGGREGGREAGEKNVLLLKTFSTAHKLRKQQGICIPIVGISLS